MTFWAASGAFLGGVLLWTLLEYVIHRFGGHMNGLGKHVRREHFQHHATPDYFTSFGRKLVLAVPVLGGLFGLGALAFGAVIGGALAGGVAFGWWGYHYIHKATHVHGPRNGYGEWARRHHLHHHFQSPKMNHGVTTPIWDWVFGTLERPETIAVPRKHVKAFAWLLDEHDEVCERYAATYRVR